MNNMFSYYKQIKWMIDIIQGLKSEKIWIYVKILKIKEKKHFQWLLYFVNDYLFKNSWEKYSILLCLSKNFQFLYL